jgi:hypothetical protein
MPHCKCCGRKSLNEGLSSLKELYLLSKTLGNGKLKFTAQYYDILKGIVNTIDNGRMAELLNEDTNTQE